MTAESVGKYAKPEIERRFLLDALPADAHDPVEITDRYIDGGHLRLRTVEDAAGTTTYKLGHKHRPDPLDPTLILHTTIYLTESEHALLDHLPGRILTKTRYRVDVDGCAAAVDALHGAHEGLILLEVGFDTAEDLRRYVPPPWVGAETPLTGGELAE